MIVLGNLTWWGSLWLVQSLAYPGHFQSPQASWRLWLRHKEKHMSETTRHHSALHSHTGVLWYLLGCLHKSLDLWKKSSRHQMGNRKEYLFSCCDMSLWFSSIKMMAKKKPPLKTTVTHLIRRWGTDLPLRSSVLFPALLQTLYLIVGKLQSLVHSFPHSQRGGLPLPPWGALRPRVSWVVAGRN